MAYWRAPVSVGPSQRRRRRPWPSGSVLRRGEERTGLPPRPGSAIAFSRAKTTLSLRRSRRPATIGHARSPTAGPSSQPTRRRLVVAAAVTVTSSSLLFNYHYVLRYVTYYYRPTLDGGHHRVRVYRSDVDRCAYLPTAVRDAKLGLGAKARLFTRRRLLQRCRDLNYGVTTIAV